MPVDLRIPDVGYIGLNQETPDISPFSSTYAQDFSDSMQSIADSVHGVFYNLTHPFKTVTNTPEVVSDIKETVSDALSPAGDFEADIPGWIQTLFENSEQAAYKQWERNENSARWAYKRSEAAADAAMNRARELRQTAYQDAVDSLKAAGLNPVLAAGGGISGSAVTAPQGTAPSASSGMASGINGADLLTAIAAIVSSSGNLLKGIASFMVPKSSSSGNSLNGFLSALLKG